MPIASDNPGRLTRDGRFRLRYHDRQRAFELFDPTTNAVRS